MPDQYAPPLSSEAPSIQPEPNRFNKLNFLWLEITNRCNLACVHCYAESGSYEPISSVMTYEDWISVLQEGAALGCKQVQFIGGEPTVYPRLLDLIDCALENNYEFVELYTNGTRLTDDLCKALKDRGVRIAISFYGNTAEVHEAVTLNRGSFNKTQDGIKRVLAHGMPLRVGVIAMKQNAAHVEQTIEMLRRLGVNEVRVDRMREFGRGQSDADKSKDMVELCGNCSNGSLAINAAGEISPCIFSHFWNVGNTKQSLSEIISGHQISKFRDEIANIQKIDTHDKLISPNLCSPNSCVPCNPDLSCQPEVHCNPWCNPGCNPGR